MTDDLGEGLRGLAEDGARQRAELQASSSVARAVRRRRSVRGGLVAAATAAVIGLVGAAAAPSVLDALESEAEPARTLSVTDTVVDHATVAFEDSIGPSWRLPIDVSGPAECGRPLPEPVGTAGDFSAAFDLPQTDELAVNGSASTSRAVIEVTYEGSDDLPALREPVTALFARDGVVVGYGSGYDAVDVSTWNTGGTTRRTWDSSSWVAACPEGDDAEQLGHEALAPGEYEVVWSMRVHASQAANAQMALLEEGYTVPHASVLDAYREGSYDCQDLMTYDGEVPLTCDPDALFGTEIDLEAGTVTFPYRASAYVRDVDATFVSDPRTMTLEADPSQDWWTKHQEAHPPYEPGTPLACGDELRAASDEVMLDWDLRWDQISAGTRHTATAWSWTPDWTDRTVELPESTRIWLLTSNDVMYELEDGTQVGTSVDVVAGWADVTMPARIELVRYDGPTDLEIAVDEVEWCENGRPASGIPPHGVIVDPHQQTDADGVTSEVDDPISVRGDIAW